MFRNNPDQAEDFKKRRQQYAEGIRKSNRQELFSKIRKTQTNVGVVDSLESNGEKLLIIDSRYQKEIEQFVRQTYTINQFNELIANIHDSDIIKQHYGLIGIRKLLSIYEMPPIQQAIDAGLVPVFIQYVKQSNYPQLQLEATWALTNIASGTTIQCQSIIDKGGIGLFVKLLTNPNLGIVEQAIWALGNIGSDCYFSRDAILKQGGLTNLIELIKRVKDRQMLKNIAWTISNVCRGNPLPRYEQVKDAIPVLCEFVKSGLLQDDKQVLSDALWAISYNSQNKKQRIDKVLKTGVLPQVVKHLSTDFLHVLVPAIRIAGNVSTGSAEQTQQLLKLDIFSRLQPCIGHEKKIVRRQTCWVISNICAGTRDQVQIFLQRKNMIERLLNTFETDSNDVKKEICHIFSNLAYNGEPQKIFALYKQTEIIRYYLKLMSQEEHKIVQTAVQCLYLILSVGDKIKQKKSDPNVLVEDLMKMQGVATLEKLQYHKSEDVYLRTVKILTTYFDLQDPLDL